MKEDNKKDSDKMEENSSLGGTPSEGENKHEQNRGLDILHAKNSTSNFGIPSSKKQEAEDTAFNIPSADSAPNVPKRALNIKPAGKKSASKKEQDDLESTSLEIDTSPDLDDTSYYLDTTDIGEEDTQKTSGSNKSLDDTDNFDAEDLKIIQSSENVEVFEETAKLDTNKLDLDIPEDEINAFKYSYDFVEEETREGKNSIMDLLDKGELNIEDLESAEPDLDENISGKSLDEILKTSQKSGEDYHESKNKSIEDKGEKQNKQNKLKISVGILILIILTATVTWFFLSDKQTDNAPDKKKVTKSTEEKNLEIPSNLKDEKKLTKFLSIAEEFYKNKKYKKAEALLNKILHTGWNKGLIYGMLGNCRLKNKDEKKAIDYYKRSIQAGNYDKIDFALSLAEILNKQEKYSEIISILEPFKKEHKSNQDMLEILSSAYDKEGNIDKTLECYKNMNTNLFSEKKLREYARLLDKKGDKEEAFKIYLNIAKLYDDIEAYLKAEGLAPDEKTRILILTQIVAKTSNSPKGTYYKMLLGMKTFDSGKKKEGLQILKTVNTDKLNKRDATKFLKMLPQFEGEKYLLQEAHSILSRYYSKDMQIHEGLKQSMINNGKLKLCENFFKDEYLLKPKNPISIYFYATIQSDPNAKIQLYKKVISLSPDFFEANLGLGIFYVNKQNWREALNYLQKCERLRPRSIESKYYSAITKINLSNTKKAYTYLKDYETFLQRIKTPKAEILKQMIMLSQYMKDQQYALLYLQKAKKIKSLEKFCQNETIKIKLIYGTLKKSDFPSIKDPEIKKYYTIYLLGKGKYLDIMEIPVTKEELPDFWKTMVLWKRDIKTWEKNAKLILQREKNNLLITTTIKMWMRKIKPEEANAIVESIDYIDRPLLFIFIGMQYDKDLNNFKSNIFYNNALNFPNPNIYTNVAEFLKNEKK